MSEPFKPPTDVKQFWLAPHCGEGTLDPNEICGYCGLTMGECARINSETVRDHHEQECGGSGLWCSGCGRFWAQDVCGESFNDEMSASDGAKMTVTDGFVHCVCGKKLFKAEQEEDSDA